MRKVAMKKEGATRPPIYKTEKVKVKHMKQGHKKLGKVKVTK